MIWWFCQGCNTPSHLELDCEKPSGQLYYDLSHGRVGRCQIFQAQNVEHLFKLDHTIKQARPYQAGFVLSGIIGFRGLVLHRGGFGFNCGCAYARSDLLKWRHWRRLTLHLMDTVTTQLLGSIKTFISQAE